jgi:hypothetical protein
VGARSADSERLRDGRIQQHSGQCHDRQFGQRSSFLYRAVVCRIWVYDVTNDRIDYSGPLPMNQLVTVDPGTNSITINGHIVSDTLQPGTQHRIYFVPA